MDKYKLITCVLPKGAAAPVLEALWKEKNITTGNINRASGTGKITHQAYRDSISSSEKEVLVVTVKQEEADHIFDYLCEKTNIDQPHHGIIYMQQLLTSTEYALPDLPVEK